MTLAALRNRIGNHDFAHLLAGVDRRSHRHGHGTTAPSRRSPRSISGQDLAVVLRRLAVQPVKPAATAENGL